MLEHATRAGARDDGPAAGGSQATPATATGAGSDAPVPATTWPPTDELAALLARSVATRGASARAHPDRPTLARFLDKGFWVIDLNGNYTWHKGTDPGTRPKSGLPDYKEQGSWYAWPVYYEDDETAAFAALASTWAQASVIALKRRFDNAKGGKSAADWVRIATAGDALKNQPADVERLAQIPGWTGDQKVALAGLYCATDQRRAAKDWVRVASLLRSEADTATFARVSDDWQIDVLCDLVDLFAADHGKRSAADWAEIACAHATLYDEGEAVAALARQKWAADAVTALVEAAEDAGAESADLVLLLSTGSVLQGLLAMRTSGWNDRDLGEFAGTMLSESQAVQSIGTFVGLKKIGLDTRKKMRLKNWDAASLGSLVSGALGAGIKAPVLQGLIGTEGFAKWSRQLVGGTTTARDVGRYSAQASMTPEAMTTAGWTLPDLAALYAAMDHAGCTYDEALALLKLSAFAKGSRAMCKAGWSVAKAGAFVAGALKDAAIDAARLAALTNAAQFAPASREWLRAGWSGAEVGAICGMALAQGLAVEPLVTFMQVDSAAASAFVLRGRWGAKAVGQTVGYCMVQAGSPTPSEMEQLLAHAAKPINGTAIERANVRKAALGATCGAPYWTTVIAQLDNFQDDWVGPRGHAAGPSASWAAPGGAVLELTIPGERIIHVEQGHTYEYLDFSYNNCNREGKEGFISFFPVGTNVLDKLTALRDNATVRGLAENAHSGSGGTQGTALNCTVAVSSVSANELRISQCYPNNATSIRGRSLIAIGRYCGQT